MNALVIGLNAKLLGGWWSADPPPPLPPAADEDDEEEEDDDDDAATSERWKYPDNNVSAGSSGSGTSNSTSGFLSLSPMSRE